MSLNIPALEVKANGVRQDVIRMLTKAAIASRMSSLRQVMASRRLAFKAI